MTSAKSRGTLLLALFFVMTVTLLPKLAGQAKPASAPSQSANLFKEVLNHKGQIQWKSAPPPGIPTQVCLMLKVCQGKEAAKFVALPRSTEGGQPVGRGLYLSGTGDPKNPDAVLLEHETMSEIYFFLLSPDGNLAKTAFIQRGGSSWMSLASLLAKPAFEKDQKAWLDSVMKIGTEGK
jgi:hypothetical protein